MIIISRTQQSAFDKKNQFNVSDVSLSFNATT